MAWDETIKFIHGVDKMVDKFIAKTYKDGMLGG